MFEVWFFAKSGSTRAVRDLATGSVALHVLAESLAISIAVYRTLSGGPYQETHSNGNQADC